MKLVTYEDLKRKLDAMTLLALRRHDALVKQQKGLQRLVRQNKALKAQLNAQLYDLQGQHIPSEGEFIDTVRHRADAEVAR